MFVAGGCCGRLGGGCQARPSMDGERASGRWACWSESLPRGKWGLNSSRSASAMSMPALCVLCGTHCAYQRCQDKGMEVTAARRVLEKKKTYLSKRRRNESSTRSTLQAHGRSLRALVLNHRHRHRHRHRRTRHRTRSIQRQWTRPGRSWRRLLIFEVHLAPQTTCQSRTPLRRGSG